MLVGNSPPAWWQGGLQCAGSEPRRSQCSKSMHRVDCVYWVDPSPFRKDPNRMYSGRMCSQWAVVEWVLEGFWQHWALVKFALLERALVAWSLLDSSVGSDWLQQNGCAVRTLRLKVWETKKVIWTSKPPLLAVRLSLSLCVCKVQSCRTRPDFEAAFSRLFLFEFVRIFSYFPLSIIIPRPVRRFVSLDHKESQRESSSEVQGFSLLFNVLDVHSVRLKFRLNENLKKESSHA